MWLPVVYLASIVASAIGESAYFLFLSLGESALLLLMVWYAWRWPRDGDHQHPPSRPDEVRSAL